MKRTALSLLAATALTATIPAVASAQTINERQNSLFNRIDAGIRSGQLTRTEADVLRSDFYALARLEADYRASYPGLTNIERNDLNRRFDLLSSRIRIERADNDGWGRNGGGIRNRVSMLVASVDRAIRNGWLRGSDASYLRAQSRELARLEGRYSVNGLTRPERIELRNRADRLEVMLERESGREFGYGYGDDYYSYYR